MTTYGLGFALLGLMCLREDAHRMQNAGVWIFLSLITGSGFFCYLWSEPVPLLQLPSRRTAGKMKPLNGELAIRNAVLSWPGLVALAAAYFALR